MPGFKLQSKRFQIREGSTVDDIADSIRLIMSMPMALERVVIEQDIRVDFWAQDAEPPFGELPEEPSQSFAEVLGRVDTAELTDSSTELNLDALAVITTMLIEANKRRRSALAWLVGDPVVFCKWLKVKPTPNRFLEIPLVKVQDVPKDKLILLCGKSAASNPLESDVGLIVSMSLEGNNG